MGGTHERMFTLYSFSRQQGGWSFVSSCLSCLLPSLLLHYNAATGDIEMGELLCDSLDAASDSDFLRFAISSDEVRQVQAPFDVARGSPSLVETAP